MPRQSAPPLERQTGCFELSAAGLLWISTSKRSKLFLTRLGTELSASMPPLRQAPLLALPRFRLQLTQLLDRTVEIGRTG